MKHYTIIDYITLTLIILIGLGLGKLAYDDYELGCYVWMLFDILCLLGFSWVVSGWIKEAWKDKRIREKMGRID